MNVSLEELAAALEAQNAELARCAKLAETLPHGAAVAESILRELDALTEPPERRVAPPAFALRA